MLCRTWSHNTTRERLRCSWIESEPSKWRRRSEIAMSLSPCRLLQADQTVSTFHRIFKKLQSDLGGDSINTISSEEEHLREEVAAEVIVVLTLLAAVQEPRRGRDAHHAVQNLPARSCSRLACV
jgi:hypothetical protein